MKQYVFLILLVFVVGAYSCGGGSKSETEESTEKRDPSEIKDCDDFLDQYEAWMDDYLKLLEDYMKNPMDTDLATQYMELMQEAMTWATKWVAMVDCADDEKYEERFEDIASKAEEKLQELGIE